MRYSNLIAISASVHAHGSTTLYTNAIYHLQQVVAINSVNFLHRTIFGWAGPILAVKFGPPGPNFVN